MTPRLHDPILVALEQAQDALEAALQDADFDAAERIDLDMQACLAGLSDVPAAQIRHDLARLTAIMGRHRQARDDLVAQLASLQRDQRRTRAVLAAYAKN